MPAIPLFCEDNGAAVATAAAAGGGNRGTTRASGVANLSWKNADDTTTPYGTSPITAGNNSYDKFQFISFTGSFNQISNCLFQHVTGNLGGGLSIFGFVSGSGCYRTPATTSNTAFIYDMSSTGLISTGYSVKVGAFGPEASGKASSTTSNPCFSEYFGTQLRTTSAAAAGDISVITWQIRYDEN